MSRAVDPLAALRKPEARTSDQGDWAAQKFVWIPDEREGELFSWPCPPGIRLSERFNG